MACDLTMARRKKGILLREGNDHTPPVNRGMPIIAGNLPNGEVKLIKIVTLHKSNIGKGLHLIRKLKIAWTYGKSNYASN